ncbi:MAG: M48 family metallopeptidase [Syntrophorhabdus sp.]
MIEFPASYFDGKISRDHKVTVRVDASSVSITGETEDIAYAFPISAISIEPVVGGVIRSIRLPNGALLQTSDNRSVDALRIRRGTDRSWNFVDFLESRWKMVAGCILFLIFFMFGLVYYAIPYASKHVARKIPFQVTASASDQVLKMLDRQFFRPSTLPQERQSEITAVFNNVTRKIDPLHAGYYKIAFRSGKNIGANAFALPSGQVVITDALVALAINDDELAAIFAHEIAHVKERHAIRNILQGTGVFFLATLLTGDVTSVANFAAILPTLMIESGYSRSFEKEADREAGLMLIADKKGVAPFRDIMRRIDESHPGTMKLGIFSSHPEILERLRYLDELEQDPGKSR